MWACIQGGRLFSPFFLAEIYHRSIKLASFQFYKFKYFGISLYSYFQMKDSNYFKKDQRF